MCVGFAFVLELDYDRLLFLLLLLLLFLYVFIYFSEEERMGDDYVFSWRERTQSLVWLVAITHPRVFCVHAIGHW